MKNHSTKQSSLHSPALRRALAGYSTHRARLALLGSWHPYAKVIQAAAESEHAKLLAAHNSEHESDSLMGATEEGLRERAARQALVDYENHMAKIALFGSDCDSEEDDIPGPEDDPPDL